MKKKSKYFYLLFGHIFLVLAIAGVLLPVIPATPFALLAAWFYKRGSPRMHQWIISLRYIGPIILEWDQKKVISVKSKIMAILILLLSLVTILSRPNFPFLVKIFIWLVFSLVARFIIYQKSQSPLERAS